MNRYACAVTVCIFSGLATTAAPSQQPPASSPAGAALCHVDLIPPTADDDALALKDYPRAEALYREDLARNPASDDARFGVVRALIGQNKVAQARAVAATWLAGSPHAPLAELAAAEAAYRSADIAAAQDDDLHAFRDNPCEGRTLDFAAALDAAFGLFGHQAHLLSLAHRLRPGDELIRRDWIASLPRSRENTELALYLSQTHSLSAEDRNNYTILADLLKAYHPGDCSINSASMSVSLPFKPIGGGDGSTYGLDVSLNGKTRRVEIDTGSSGILLTSSAAKRLGLRPEYRLHTGGVGDQGKAGGYLTHVASIRIGEMEISNCVVEVLDQTNMEADGLIGIDVFGPWLVTLDYPHSQLRLNPLPARPAAPDTGDADPDSSDQDPPRQDRYIAPGMEHWLHVLRMGHMLLLPASLNHGPRHYVIVDSGAVQTIFSPAFIRETHADYLDSNLHFSGLSGSVTKAYRVDGAVLSIENFQLPPTTYYAFDLANISPDIGVEVSGLLGVPTLSQLVLSIDYRDNLMHLVYDAGSPPRLRAHIEPVKARAPSETAKAPANTGDFSPNNPA